MARVTFELAIFEFIHKTIFTYLTNFRLKTTIDKEGRRDPG